MPDGEYRLGSHGVRKCNNGVRLPDGTLAGSCLTMHEAFKNLISVGLSMGDAARRCSQFPAEYLGIEDRGRIVPGAFADLLVLDEELTLRGVFVEGERLE
jgi:N-acetylglucosamine-6-phosphate deacetylase